MAIQSSTELQMVSLASILKDIDLFNQVKSYLNEQFFSTSSYKLIYNSLVYFNAKTSKLPTLEELHIVVGDMYNQAYGELGDVKNTLNELYYYQVTDTSFLIDKLTTFIKRNRVEGTIKDLLPKIQGGNEIAIEEIGDKLIESVNIEINTTDAFRLSDTSNLSEVRRQAVGTDSNPTIIKSCIPTINNKLTFKGYKPGDLIMFVSAPGSGKTMWMINECSYCALQGFTAIHIFVGDMKEYDGFIRYTSRLTGILQDDLVGLSVEEQVQLINQYNYQGVCNRIFVKSYPAGAVTIDKLHADINQLQKKYGVHFDMIAIDYPDNLIAQSSMMYESGGDIYNTIAKIGYYNSSVMLTGSQPKVNYWNDEIIPLSGAAESSKKQHVVDVMITAGKRFKGSKMITYHLCKVRRGDEGAIIRINSSFEKAYLEQTTDEEYMRYISENS